MLHRHLDVPVYDDSRRPLCYQHCSQRMDHRGDHATKYGFSIRHCHNSLHNCIAWQLFKPSGLAYRLKVLFLILDSAHSLAEILVQASAPLPGALPLRPTAYDVTVRSPCRSGIINKAAKQRVGAAKVAEADKVQTLNRTLCDALLIAASDPIPPLDWTFTRLAFDTLGAPSARNVSVIEVHAQKSPFVVLCPMQLRNHRLNNI